MQKFILSLLIDFQYFMNQKRVKKNSEFVFFS